MALSDKAQKMLDFFKANDVQSIPINKTKYEDQAPHVQELIDAGHFKIDKKHRDLVLINENKLEILIRKVIKEERQKLRELSTEDEINHLATSLLDYLGGEIEDLPNWKADPSIVKFFRDNSISGNLCGKIYQRALELSRDNAPKPRNRKYLDN